MRVERSVIVGRPVEDVFALVGNPDNDVEWGSLIVESEQMTPGPIHVGSLFRQTASFLGARLTATLEVTAYEPGRRLCYQARQPAAIDHCRRLEAVPQGTKLTFSTTIEVGGKLKLPSVMVQRMGARQMESDLEEIRTTLEAATPREP